MKIYIYLLTLLAMTSCMSIKSKTSRVVANNDIPRYTVPFNDVDVDNSGDISREEYIPSYSTLDVDTPFSALIGILFGVGLLVSILIFLTTCYKGPCGLPKHDE